MKTLKTIVLIFVISLITKALHAQLQDNAWRGTFMTPSPRECVFDFKIDTVYLNLAEDIYANEANDITVLEKSIYKIEGDTLTFEKVTGISPCDREVIGKYHFVIKNEKLSLLLIDDDCRERAMSFPSEPLTLVK